MKKSFFFYSRWPFRIEINKEIVIKKNCERYHFLENLYKKFAFSVDNARQI